MNQDITNNRSGLLAGGNWIIDQVKMIDVYPKHEQLANIFDQSQGTGGSPYNVLLDLAKMGAGFPLVGAGLVGQDRLGEYILEDCRSNGIDPAFISVSPGTSTSYTDVMTEIEGGRRTFFHNRGANATWAGEILISQGVMRKFFISVTCSYWMQLMRKTRSMELWGLLYSPKPGRLALKPASMW